MSQGKVGSPAAPPGGTLQSIEMFAGAGGMALGVSRAGFRHAAVNELDPYACQTLTTNAGSAWNVLEGDSRDVDWSVFAGSIDLIGAGAPCQPFSVAGQAHGDGDERNMFPEAVRAVHEVRPQAVLLENVKGLGRPAFRAYVQYILNCLRMPEVRPRPSELWERHAVRVSRALKSGTPSYRVLGPHDLDSADFGVPQSRHRLFVVAFRSDIETSSFSWPEPTHSRDALLWDQVHGSYWQEHGIASMPPPAGRRRGSAARRAELEQAERPRGKRWQTVRDALNGLPPPGAGDLQGHELVATRATKYPGHTGNILDWPAKTVKAGVHGIPGGEGIVTLDDGSARRLTVRETARLQSFPDHWQLAGPRSRALRQLGNAVPVVVAEALASSIRSVLEPEAITAGSK